MNIEKLKENVEAIENIIEMYKKDLAEAQRKLTEAESQAAEMEKVCEIFNHAGQMNWKGHWIITREKALRITEEARDGYAPVVEPMSEEDRNKLWKSVRSGTNYYLLHVDENHRFSGEVISESQFSQAVRAVEARGPVARKPRAVTGDELSSQCNGGSIDEAWEKVADYVNDHFGAEVSDD